MTPLVRDMGNENGYAARAFVGFLVCMLLVVPVSCDTGDSPRQSGKPKGTCRAGGHRSEETAPEHKREDPVPCPSGPMSSWKMHEPTTVSESVGDLVWMTPDVVVSRAGTATVAFGSADDVVRTADDPPAPGDPQDPAHGEQETSSQLAGVHLGIDAADVQTLMYQKFVRLLDNSGSSNEIVDLMLPDRVPGGEWSSSSCGGERARVAVRRSPGGERVGRRRFDVAGVFVSHACRLPGRRRR